MFFEKKWVAWMAIIQFGWMNLFLQCSMLGVSSSSSTTAKRVRQVNYSGNIGPVIKPTPWISSLVIEPKKDGSLRLCLDPKDLNKAIKRKTIDYQQ